MITNFEDLTCDLTYEERKIFLPFICTLLEDHEGKDRAITNKRIRQLLENQNLKITGVRVRKIINIIRNKDIVPCLVSSRRGYYVSRNKDEIDRCIQSLTERCRAIWQVAESLKRQKQEMP